MSSTAAAVAAGAVTFVWLGMVLAISFLEAPLKFRAPGVTIPVGLGIGRLVFRALNAVEVLLALAVVIAVALGRPSAVVVAFTVVVVALLVVQLTAIRPRLNRRSDDVLAGASHRADGPAGTDVRGESEQPRSHGHLAYVACEVVKVLALLGLGVSLLART
ncbi:hypothetical protein SAMN05421678_12047 [Actinopolymorpha cephalotaxi]|uniref:DUF4149 domain-containing protein n=1 Tax=Actinopolymorpha cephalotaxi TaxID=504797 RepID=A0A1I3ARW9_9ACTN|nr:hypothetical protein [Actinopolymorpha cephalotaxi]NYH86033.1 hypothetical protein [Actinopolymorpha cephalotaxi]SFH52764.1 hypothetical protein SAMN05421678_12047 [Actinopolymorpha cephalotaxi]